MVDSDRNEGKDYFEINRETGEIFTKVMFDREKQGAYALEVEARDGAPSARPNSNGQPNSGMKIHSLIHFSACFRSAFEFDRVQNTFIREFKYKRNKSGDKFGNFLFFRMEKYIVARGNQSRSESFPSSKERLRVSVVSMLRIDSLVNALWW